MQACRGFAGWGEGLCIRIYERIYQMKKDWQWKVLAGIAMLVLSAGFYYLHYWIFRDAHHIFIYLLGDVAFVFIEVLLVTLIIHHLLSAWEKRTYLKKLTMVIEVFFSEFGKHLLVYLSNFDNNRDQIQKYISSEARYDDVDLRSACRVLKQYRSDIAMDKMDIGKLTGFLKDKRPFLVNLLQNPSLLEHESFTEALMAVFHLAEELAAREGGTFSAEDWEHTQRDIQRAYDRLVYQWVQYMRYTKANYPYFFLFALRTNPFDDKNSWLDKWYEPQKNT